MQQFMKAVVSLIVAISIQLWPIQLQAQQPRRWLADPPLLKRVSADTQ